MGKIASGLLGALLAVGALLYALSVGVRSMDAWFLQRIPFVLGLEVPRVLFLGLAAVWLMGAAQLIWSGFMERAAIAMLIPQLRSGKTASELLVEFVREFAWADDSYRGVARCIVQRIAYPRIVAAVVRKTGEAVDTVALRYKQVLNVLAERAQLIRQAAATLGVEATDLPSLDFPAARVVTAPAWFSGLHQGDLICSYDGNLVDSVETLQALAARETPGCKVKVGVIRYVQKTFHNPLSGIENDYAWETHTVEIKGGAFQDGVLEDNAVWAASSPSTPTILEQAAANS